MTKIDMVETVDETAVPTELKEKKEEKETPSETLTEEKPADSKEGDLEEKPEEEPVEETPEEEPEVSDDAEDRETKGLKAQQDKLKKEVKDNIVGLRAQRREQRKETPPPESKPTEVEDFDPDDTARMKKFIKAEGLVPKEEIISELNRKDLLSGMTNADDKFLEDNPEYIFSLELRQAHDNIMDSLKEAPTAEEYKKQLELAHDIVKDKNPTLFPSSSNQTLAAKKQALDLAGKGKGGGAGSPQKESAMSSEEKNAFRRAGYSDEEIERMNKIKQNK